MQTQSFLDDPNRLIRAKELKTLFGVNSDTTLWRWVQSGKIPPPKYLNACRVWRAADLAKALESMKTSVPPTKHLSKEANQ